MAWPMQSGEQAEATAEEERERLWHVWKQNGNHSVMVERPPCLLETAEAIVCDGTV